MVQLHVVVAFQGPDVVLLHFVVGLMTSEVRRLGNCSVH